MLGAGINGAAVARELVLGGVDVVVVDKGDLAGGATAYSSRLIHGGLRYLEYGEFDLVRESLAERTRLLRLAPQFVRPLKLCIPVSNRLGGLGKSIARFSGWKRSGGATRPEVPRGLWLVRGGLWLYDFYARDPELPKHEAFPLSDPRAVQVDRKRYRWMCAYYDAQILYPERFVVALLEDARQAAAAAGASFELFTYHHARLSGSRIDVYRSADAAPATTFEPAAIVNATGAWVDLTLNELEVPSPRLMGGTQGSHIVTHNKRLRDALGDAGLYAEADDGRPVFVLPFGDALLIGTTDVRFEGDPASAVVTPGELDYLLRTVNAIVPGVDLGPEDVDLHYCGVRPLPYQHAEDPASITRRHWLQPNTDCAVPLYSVIGGKLTTCRSLAEETAAAIRARLGLAGLTVSRDRPLPGAEGYPAAPQEVAAQCTRLAAETGFSAEQACAVWRLVGTRAARILLAGTAESRQNVVGTDLPEAFVRWVIRNEWVRTLGDLVERRLMLLYDRRLSQATLRQLARLLVEEAVMGAEEARQQVSAASQRLEKHFGKRVPA